MSTTDATTPLSLLPFQTEVPLRFGDMDPLGHINNVSYFRFMEQARVQFMRHERGGLSGDAQADFPYVVAHSELDYRAPMTYVDTCIVAMGVGRIGASSFTFLYELFSKQRRQLAARGSVVLVAVDHTTGRPMPIPEELRRRLASYRPSDYHETPET